LPSPEPEHFTEPSLRWKQLYSSPAETLEMPVRGLAEAVGGWLPAPKAKNRAIRASAAPPAATASFLPDMGRVIAATSRY
jgi:hypothetical protein